MVRMAAPPRAGLGLALALALAAMLAGCLDVAEPTPLVQVRVAHGALGLGNATVLLNSEPAGFNLNAQSAVGGAVPAARHIWDFVIGTDTASLSVTHDADINGIVLLDRDDPTVHHFPLELLFADVRIMVINGDFTTAESMTVRVIGADSTHEGTVGPGDHFLIEPGTGTFQVEVRPGGGEEFFAAEPITLSQGDNGFLVLAPDPAGEPDSPFARLLF